VGAEFASADCLCSSMDDLAAGAFDGFYGRQPPAASLFSSDAGAHSVSLCTEAVDRRRNGTGEGFEID